MKTFIINGKTVKVVPSRDNLENKAINYITEAEAKAYEARVKNYTYKNIAIMLNVSISRAQQLVKRAEFTAKKFGK